MRLFGSRLRLKSEGISELREKPFLRHGAIRRQTDAGYWRHLFIFGPVAGSENHIPDHENVAVIMIRDESLFEMVPAVQLGGIENPIQRPQLEIDVRVGKQIRAADHQTGQVLNLARISFSGIRMTIFPFELKDKIEVTTNSKGSRGVCHGLQR